MKKLSFILACVALMAFAACNKEADTQITEGNSIEAVFEVSAPELATKAISDGLTAGKLFFYLYDKNGDLLFETNSAVESPAYPVTFNKLEDKKWSVKVRLIKDMQYKIVFWAQWSEADAFTLDAAAKTLTVDYSKMTLNADDEDAFWGTIGTDPTDPFIVNGPATKVVTLKRPFAQLNVAIPAEDLGVASFMLGKYSKSVAAITTNYTLSSYAYNTMNLLDGTVSDNAASSGLTLVAQAQPNTNITIGDKTYKHMAMAYILVGDKVTNDVTLTVDTKADAIGTAGVLTRTILNVPLQRNYRTNIIGNIFSVEEEFTVEVDNAFGETGTGAYGDVNVPDYVPTFGSIEALNAELAKGVNAVALDMTAVDGTIYLPNTTEDIYLYILNDLSAAGNVLNVVYTEGAAAHPANLYVYAKNLYHMDGTVPDTHVEVCSYSHIDTGTISTSGTTLVIQPFAYYGNLRIIKGALKVEGKIAQATLAPVDPSVPINVTIVKDAEKDINGQIVILDVTDGTTSVSTVNSEGGAPTVDPATEDADKPAVGTMNVTGGSATVEENSTVTTVNQSGSGYVSIDEDAKVDNVEADDPSKITGEGAADVEFLIKNEAQLTAAVEAKVANMKIGESFTITRGYTIEFPTDINLNGFTISADATNTSEFPNSRAFKFAGTDAMTIKVHNGEIKLLDNNLYGSFRMDNQEADFVLDSLKLNNSRSYGLGIKVVEAKSLTLTNSTLNCVIGGGIEQGAINCDVTVSNCVINQTILDTAQPFISTALAACSNAELIVNEGTYSGYTAAYLYSSGGLMVINDGTFTGSDAAIHVQNNSDDKEYVDWSVVYVKGGIFNGPLKLEAWGSNHGVPGSYLEIYGGKFTAETGHLFNVTGDESYLTVYGGSFSEDPTAYLYEGFEAIYNEETHYWDVQVKKVVLNETTNTYYPSLESAMTEANNNEVLVVLQDCVVENQTDVTKTITINATGKKITNNSTGRICKVYGDVTLTLNGGQYIGNGTQLGFVDLRSSSNVATGKEKLIVNDASFTGVTDYGTFFGIRASGQEVTLNNVNCNVGGNVGSIVNGNDQECKLTIIGGTYNYDSALTTYGVFQAGKFTAKSNNTTILLSGVTINTTSGPVIEGHGNVTIENCIFQDPQAEQSRIWCNSGIAAACGAEVSVDNGTYIGQNAVFAYDSGSEITITGGTFTGSEKAISIDNNTSDFKWQGASTVYVSGGTFTGTLYLNAEGNDNANSTLYISGGSFSAEAGKLFNVNGSKSHIVITGGTFSEDPSAYVASGYQAVQSGDTWTVTAK